MNQSQPWSPEEIIAFNNAFSTSLSTLNNVAHLQRMEVLSMVVGGLEQMVKLCHDNNTVANTAMANLGNDIKEKLGQISTGTQESPAPNIPKDESIADATWYGNMLHSLAIAQANAANIQQQTNTTALAALTELIANMIQVVTASMAKSAS